MPVHTIQDTKTKRVILKTPQMTESDHPVDKALFLDSLKTIKEYREKCITQAEDLEVVNDTLYKKDQLEKKLIHKLEQEQKEKNKLKEEKLKLLKELENSKKNRTDDKSNEKYIELMMKMRGDYKSDMSQTRINQRKREYADKYLSNLDMFDSDTEYTE